MDPERTANNPILFCTTTTAKLIQKTKHNISNADFKKQTSSDQTPIPQTPETAVSGPDKPQRATHHGGARGKAARRPRRSGLHVTQNKGFRVLGLGS